MYCYAEIAALADDGGAKRQISINNGTTTDRVQLYYESTTNQISVFYKAQNGATQFVIDNILSNASEFNKIAFKWKANDFALWVNGTETNTISSGVTSNANALTKLDFDQFNGNTNFYGKTKALSVYKEALTDANLRSLTYPNAVATTFDLDFDTIAEQFTFTRGSEATFVNAQGLIESTASNDAPRIDYSTGAKAFLLEPQSTNLIPYSEDFSNAAWTKTRCTIDAGGHTSPSGENNAFKMTATDDDARLQDGGEPTGVIYTQSIYVKSATGSDVDGQIDFTGTQIVTFTATEQWQRVVTTSDNTRAGRVRVRITNSGDELLIWERN